MVTKTLEYFLTTILWLFKTLQVLIIVYRNWRNQRWGNRFNKQLNQIEVIAVDIVEISSIYFGGTSTN